MKLEELVKMYEEQVLTIDKHLYEELKNEYVDKFFVKKISNNRQKIVAYIGEYQFRIIVRRKQSEKHE